MTSRLIKYAAVATSAVSLLAAVPASASGWKDDDCYRRDYGKRIYCDKCFVKKNFDKDYGYSKKHFDKDKDYGYGKFKKPHFNFQNADIDANANTRVKSVINATSRNDTDIDQSGGRFQNADVDNNANTNVDSRINAGSFNAIDLDQR